MGVFSNPSERVSIIYGKNGSGKSTIADAFSAYKSGENNGFSKIELHNVGNNKIDLSDEARQNIFVFDEKYINENIGLKEDGLSTIVMFGEQVSLDKEIKVLEVELERHKAVKKRQQEVSSKYDDRKNPQSPEYHYETIKKFLREDGWSIKDSAIKGHKTNTSVNDTVIEGIIRSISDKSIEELQVDFDEKYALYNKIKDGGQKHTKEIKTIPFKLGFEDELIAALARVINKPEMTDRENEIMSVVLEGHQALVEDAKERFITTDKNVCPYCFQPVSEEYKARLIKSIEKVLNKDVEMHKEELDDLKLGTIDFDDDHYSRLDSSQRDRVRATIRLCNGIIEKYNSCIDKKISNIYTPIQMSPLDLSNHIEKLNIELKKLEDLRESFDNSVRKADRIKDELLELNKQIARYQIINHYEHYEKQREEKKIEEQKLLVISQEIGEKDKRKSELNQKKKSIKIASDYINRALEYVFFCKDRLAIEAAEDIYHIKAFDKLVKPCEVSSGERNIIALCYFFTQILNDQTDKEAYKKKCLLIIDDPITSFDFENRVGILSFLQLQSRKILSGNQGSRIIWLSHDLGTVNNLIAALIEIDSIKCGKLELLNKALTSFDPGNRHEYTLLMEHVYSYAKGEKDNELIIGNIMRRVLEAFSTFEYKEGIRKVSRNQDVLEALPSQYRDYFQNLMYRFILHDESHYEGNIKTLPDLNLFNFISAEEKGRTAKDILCFIYLLNRTHVKAHLKGVAGAEDDIKQWCKNIVS